MRKIFPIYDTLSLESQSGSTFLQKFIESFYKRQPIFKNKYAKIETAAQNSAAIYFKLKNICYNNKTVFKTSAKPAAIALTACALLLSLGCAANNGVIKDSATLTKANTRVTAYKTIKSTNLAALSFNNTSWIFSPFVTQTNTKSSLDNPIAPTQGNYAGDPFKAPQCTWYVWGRVKALTGVSLMFNETSGRAARYWLNQVIETGSVKAVSDKNAVRAHSVAVFRHGGKNEGHVVFIENVIRDSLNNPVSIIFSESNWGKDKAPSQKQISWNEFLSRSDDSLKGYIYI